MIAMDLLPGPYWRHVARCDPIARALADRHYSRQTIGAAEFMGPGRAFVLLGRDGLAVWGVNQNLDASGTTRFRCTIFRNEGVQRSSDLIREATSLTLERWRRRGWLYDALTTEIDPQAVRHKRDPGRCFRRAGWREVDQRRGLMILEAPA